MEILRNFAEIPNGPHVGFRCKKYSGLPMDCTLFVWVIPDVFYVGGDAMAFIKPKDIANRAIEEQGLDLVIKENSRLFFELESVHPHCLQAVLEIFLCDYQGARRDYINRYWEDYFSPELIKNLCVIPEMLHCEELRRALDNVFCQANITHDPELIYCALWLCNRFRLKKTLEKNNHLLEAIQGEDVVCVISKLKQVKFEKKNYFGTYLEDYAIIETPIFN